MLHPATRLHECLEVSVQFDLGIVQSLQVNQRSLSNHPITQELSLQRAKREDQAKLS